MKLTDESPSRPSLAWTVTHNPAALWQALAPGLERWRSEWKPLAAILAVFLAIYYLPLGVPRFDAAIMEALELAKWYAREHVVLCLLPAFFIAGAIAVFVSQASVMKYLRRERQSVGLWRGVGVGHDLGRLLVYGVAAICRHLSHGCGTGAGYRLSLTPARPSMCWLSS